MIEVSWLFFGFLWLSFFMLGWVPSAYFHPDVLLLAQSTRLLSRRKIRSSPSSFPFTTNSRK